MYFNFNGNYYILVYNGGIGEKQWVGSEREMLSTYNNKAFYSKYLHTHCIHVVNNTPHTIHVDGDAMHPISRRRKIDLLTVEFFCRGS